MSSENVVETDVLVIGGGIAGCFAAIKAREQGLDVTIVDKAYAGKSGASIGACRSWMVYNPEWGVDFDECMHAFNTECEYINNREWDEIILNESMAIYQDLVSWGVKFPPDSLQYIKEFPPFGNVRLTYREIPPTLRKQAKRVGVKIMDRIMITDLLKKDGKVVGAIGFSYDTGDSYTFKAKATVLAGGSNSFKPNGYPVSILTGDAEGMAYRAGAEITGKEFLTTHSSPSRYFAWMAIINSPGYLTHFTDAEGTRHISFVGGTETGTGFEPDLTTEFVVHAGKGPIFWDYGNLTPEDMKAIDIHQQTYGVKEHDPKVQISGGATAGYADVGTAGVWVIDTKCATNLPGLYAAGDCGGTRHNGAFTCNTGLGTSPAAVTGRRAGAGAAEHALQAEKPELDKEELARLKKVLYAPAERKSGFSPRWVTQLLQNTVMPYFILHIRHGERLQAALTTVAFLSDHIVPQLTVKDAHELRLAHETKNMVLNAEMILQASLFRTESRGVHYREDYPRRDDPNWLAWVKIMQDEQGGMKLLKEPVPEEWWPDLMKPYEERYPRRFPGE